MRKHIESYEFNTNFVNKVLDSFYVDQFSGGENDFDFLQLARTLELHTYILGEIILLTKMENKSYRTENID